MSKLWPITLERGGTFRYVIEVQQPAGVALNLAGCSATMIFERPGSPPVASHILSEANGGVVMDTQAGTISMYLPDAEVARLNFPCAHRVLLRLSTGDVLPLLYGPVTMT